MDKLLEKPEFSVCNRLYLSAGIQNPCFCAAHGDCTVPWGLLRGHSWLKDPTLHFVATVPLFVECNCFTCT